MTETPYRKTKHKKNPEGSYTSTYCTDPEQPTTKVIVFTKMAATPYPLAGSVDATPTPRGLREVLLSWTKHLTAIPRFATEEDLKLYALFFLSLQLTPTLLDSEVVEFEESWGPLVPYDSALEAYGRLERIPYSEPPSL